MAIPLDVSVDPNAIFNNISLLIGTLQAIGFIAVLWLIFQVISLWYNRRKQKLLEKLIEKVDTLGKKIDILIKKKK